MKACTMTPEAPLDTAFSTISLTVLGMSATLKSQMTSDSSDSLVIMPGPSESTSGQLILMASTIPETDSATFRALAPSVSSNARMSLLSIFMRDGLHHHL